MDKWNGDADVKKGLKNLTATIAYFGGKKVDDEGAKLAARYLGLNTALTTLRLYDNSIGDAGAAAIGKALASNSTLTTLYVCYGARTTCRVGDVGAAAFLEALPGHPTLTHLYLQSDKISNAMREKLKAAKSAKLTTLDL